jgi:uncharacterized membrane protein YfcA
MPWYHYLVLFASAAIAGAVNSVAGGGTLLTFPALLWAGKPEIIANATSTVALWPGQLSSLWGYRSQLGRSRGLIAALAVPSFLGGFAGAALLLRTKNETFAAIVPYLILLATCLFMAQGPVNRWLGRRAARSPGPNGPPEADRLGAAAARPSDGPGLAGRWVLVLVFQFFVGTYGGYFGAGIGILMLAALGFLGLTNIHRMNGLKNINNMCINAVAAVMFLAKGLVDDWPVAGLMAAGAIVGGYAGAGIARRIGQENVRRMVIAIGFLLTLSLLLRRWSGG